MIIEHALLPVRPDRADEFEAAFAEARPTISSDLQAVATAIASMPGFRSLSLSRCLETPDTYLLLVGWERLADHVDGFRGSAGYQRWQQLLHHFYDPFPDVHHFQPVLDDPAMDPLPAVTASTPNQQ
ncbi:antibiotic biosynthesis monooxygenase [Nocardia sp. NBC_00565]|uniref:antibiotic biosynthesis monooxygenase family protein n=1 Tax=Nocardia sp. NBC_00565 TaxID=2975993 RepID=UPI002E81AA6C|nr:antibiotic biosynthesis monooxygenase [Nocardia sp. NBC_00565]WUC04539.1 antibiotic biosynthesis monooxygenase [Nocardia sp. NBC_00565]